MSKNKLVDLNDHLFKEILKEFKNYKSKEVSKSEKA